MLVAAVQGSRQIAAVAARARSAVQLAENAGHASASVSSAQPGRSSKATGRSSARSAAVVTAAAGGGLGALGGSVLHAAQSAASAAQATLGSDLAVIWFFIEALVALLLAVFIVWFTMGGKRKRSAPSAEGDEGEQD